jgi:pseudoazurin
MVSAWRDLERNNILKVAWALLACATLATLSIPPTHAEEHIVRTRRAEWVPSVLFIQPGDTVIWQGMNSHETELIEEMGPAGATAWDSEIDAEGFRVTLETEGAYIYSCEIHMNFGMVGAIVVGDGQPQNLAAIDAALPAIEVGRVFVSRTIDRMKRALSRRN